MPWRGWEDPEEALIHLRSEGYTLVAVEQAEPSVPLTEWNWVDSKLLALCDWALEIPQWGSKHSLNVSVCAGILFWEAARRALLK